MSAGEDLPDWARPNETRYSKNFFKREPDNSVRLRLRFSAEEASLIEEAAGKTPLLVYIHRVLNETAKRHIRASQKSKTPREKEEG